MGEKQEITPETRLVLIELAEGFAEGMRNGTFRFTEAQGNRLVEAAQTILSPQPKMQICNITQACASLGISQPTSRKYVRQGLLPQGTKIAGLTELLWDKADIERFKKERAGKKG